MPKLYEGEEEVNYLKPVQEENEVELVIVDKTGKMVTKGRALKIDREGKLIRIGGLFHEEARKAGLKVDSGGKIEMRESRCE